MVTETARDIRRRQLSSFASAFGVNISFITGSVLSVAMFFIVIVGTIYPSTIGWLTSLNTVIAGYMAASILGLSLYASAFDPDLSESGTEGESEEDDEPSLRESLVFG